VYGEGSVFTAMIPQRVVDSIPVGFVEAPELTHTGKNEPEIKFIAPDARVLAVDDIDTNLTVLKGLLAPYQMEITLCQSGAEAIEEIKKHSIGEQHSFDFVLMDHMMPEMDGIEATAAIRSLKGEYYRQLPIIALTANAVIGMKEMFLEKGFNDFLSKPIELTKLDELMAKWVPKEKQIKTTIIAQREKFEENMEIMISDIDVTKGITMTGGTLEGYKKVLASFRKDALERMPYFAAAPTETDFTAFAVHAHALKSAAGTIGAAELSTEAAELEAAGKAGDKDTIERRLSDFYEHLKETAEKIGAALVETQNTESGPGLNAADAAVYALFKELKANLEAKDMEAIDRVTGELAGKGLDAETTETLDAVSDLLLVSKFKAAVEKIDELLNKIRGR
jgi:CheY-like chemotaxis protein/HPt (histidine-containing phosphotransfer) domain-containing protein